MLFPEVYSTTAKMTDAQFGVLMRAVFAYRFERKVYQGDDLAVDISFRTIAGQIDRYAEICEINSNNAKPEDTAESSGKQGNAANCRQGQQNTPPIPSPIPIPGPSPIEDSVGADKPPARTPVQELRKSFGAFGWVKLTDAQHQKLLDDLGEAELNRCISYIDEAAQATGNKNHWKDWSVVIRKCSRQKWGVTAESQNTKSGGEYEHGVDKLARLYQEEFGG